MGKIVDPGGKEKYQRDQKCHPDIFCYTTSHIHAMKLSGGAGFVKRGILFWSVDALKEFLIRSIRTTNIQIFAI